jgi:hypothetical protein
VEAEMRRAAILAVALLVAASTGASADNWQRLACSKDSDGSGAGQSAQPPPIRFVFNMTTMTWWQVGAGNENNVLWADGREFYLTTVDRLNEANLTEFTLDKPTLRLKDENRATIYRCLLDVPQPPG